MKELEKLITPFVKTHLPEFYQEEGPDFIRFIDEYYSWLQLNNLTLTTTEVSVSNSSTTVTSISNTTSNTAATEGTTSTSFTNATSTVTTSVTNKNIAGQTIYKARSLSEYRDIDDTVDDFLVYFSKKFLSGIDFTSETDKRRLIKASLDLFKSKGTPQSIELFFRLLFNKSVEVTYPGDDILRTSDGEWHVPTYLEVTRTTRNTELVGREVVGSKSSAKAFVEFVITRNIKGKFIDVLFLSNVRGTFEKNEYVTDDGLIKDAPKITGSLNSGVVTVPGAGFSIGEEVSVISERGVEGTAIITGTATQSGIIEFRIVLPGWGYSTNTSLIVSNKVIFVSNVTNSNSSITGFTQFERVQQNLHSISLSNVSASFIVGDTVKTPSGNAGIIVYSTYDPGTSTAEIRVNTTSGNILSNSYLYDTQEILLALSSNAYIVGEAVFQSNSTATLTVGTISTTSNTTTLSITPGTIGSNGFSIGQFIKQNTSNANGFIVAVSANANFNPANVNHIVIGSVSGTFNNTSLITAYSNTSNVTQITTATPNTATLTRLVKLVNLEGETWDLSGYVRGNILGPNTLPVTVGYVVGTISSNSNISATGNAIASNATAIGITNISNTFYSVNGSFLVGTLSNTYANIVSISTGQGAGVKVGSIVDAETVRVSPDLFYSNNANSIRFDGIGLLGNSAGYKTISDILLANGGSSYSNTDIITYTGTFGTSGYLPANGTIITDDSGTIVVVNISGNTGANLTSNPVVSVSNSSGGTPVGTGANLYSMFSYGFAKEPSGDASFPMLSLLTFQNKTIGSIASLSGINPGENYNARPFVVALEDNVASYGKRDFLIELGNYNGNFSNGEVVEQTISTPAFEVYSNNFSGNTSNLYDVGENVYTTNGIDITAEGTVYSTTLNTSTNTQVTVVIPKTNDFSTAIANTVNAIYLFVDNNTLFDPGERILQGSPQFANGTIIASNSSLIVVDAATSNGTFITSNNGGSPVNEVYNIDGGYAIVSEARYSNTYAYKLFGRTTKGESLITNFNAYTASSLARGRVVGKTSNSLNVQRLSLFTEFATTASNNLIGRTSGANAAINSVYPDSTSNVAGFNAIVTANVVSAPGGISSFSINSSGFGHDDQEISTIRSFDGLREATVKLTANNQGIGIPYYNDTKGFLSNNKYIYDGLYYQDHSYVINSELPFEKYGDMLKEILHVAGTNIIGGIRFVSTSNVQVTANSSQIQIS